ncbi:DUF2267 domain-containing protein [Spongiivirga citrea]|uniref:DUF2267 domain-containing protein n=1 Tax=Spongiivirga citrea TaxID=1481457 RepID=A0A6M0CMT7_9FLAO|nr:DUF2267 domain-containing protein [Spongiivirga citrea]NER16797.1 DUF2267 domain-containing protein [Spongiivirga citrea]
MALNFNQYAAEGNTFLKQYAKQIGLPDNPDRAGRVLTAILHGLRSIISVEESLQLIAQLPMFLKAVYVNGWSIKAHKEKVKNVEGFIDLIRTFDGKTSLYDFESNEIAEDYITSTFMMLKQYVSDGEMEDIRGELPKALKGIIFNHIFI